MSRQQVSEHWGDAEANARLAEIHWMGSPVVRAYLNRLASGSPDVDWLTHLWGKHVRGRELEVLVLGCGEGWLERSLAPYPEIATIDACDISEQAVATARATAEAQRLTKLHYHVLDLNEDPPPGEAYDVVIAHSVLHHIENLELAYPEIHRRLRPGGVILINEYVGPRRFQFSPIQMRWINRLLAPLPERLRTSAVTRGPYPEKVVPGEEAMIATDPSEAVRSDELLTFSRETFEIVEEIDYGGTVLHHLLYDIVQGFDPGEPRDSRLLGLLCLFEETLIHCSILPADFALLVGRKGPPSPAAPPSAPSSAQTWPVAPPLDPASGDRETPGERLALVEPPRRSWRLGLEWPAVRRVLHRQATGQESCDWLTWVLAEHRQPHPRRALVAEPLARWLEERLRDDPAVGEVDYLTSVTGELHVLTAEGREEPLGEERYDWVFTSGALGSAPQSSWLSGRIHRAMRPGGLLVGDDYIGSPEEPVPAATLHFARELVELLQPAPRPSDAERPSKDHRPWWRALRIPGRRRPGLASTRRRVQALLGDGFQILACRELLGSLLQRLLDTAGARLDVESPEDQAFVDLVCQLEELLADQRILRAEYACFLARKKTLLGRD